MSDERVCDWCDKLADCEEENEEWICEDCAVWDCPKCGSVTHVGEYHCGNCDGCDSCCGCPDDDDDDDDDE